MLNENDAPCIKEQEPNATNVRNHTTNTTPKEFKNKGSPHDPNNHNRSTIRNQNKLKKHGIPYVKEQESTAIHVQNCTTNTMPKKFKDKDNPYDVNNHNPSTIHNQNRLKKHGIPYVKEQESTAIHVQNCTTNIQCQRNSKTRTTHTMSTTTIQVRSTSKTNWRKTTSLLSTQPTFKTDNPDTQTNRTKINPDTQTNRTKTNTDNPDTQPTHNNT